MKKQAKLIAFAFLSLPTMFILLAYYQVHIHAKRSIVPLERKRHHSGSETTQGLEKMLLNSSSSVSFSLLHTSRQSQQPRKTWNEPITYLLTPRDFNASLSKNPCVLSKPFNWTMYTFVKSTASAFIHRSILRDSWVSLSYVEGARFVTVFVIGLASEDVQNVVNEESRKYGDILQINASDEYKDISRKTLTGMQWARENLPEDYFYSSADDDFLVNIGEVQETIDHFRATTVEETWPIICMFVCRRNDKPNRDTKSKYYISHQEYQPPDWPEYCLGGMYSTTVRTVSRLWEASRTQKLIKMDDVWITGLLRENIGMPGESVKAIKSPTAVHYWGFYDRNEENKETYLKKEWKDIYNTFKDKSLCIHDIMD